MQSWEAAWYADLGLPECLILISKDSGMLMPPPHCVPQHVMTASAEGWVMRPSAHVETLVFPEQIVTRLRATRTGPQNCGSSNLSLSVPPSWSNTKRLLSTTWNAEANGKTGRPGRHEILQKTGFVFSWPVRFLIIKSKNKTKPLHIWNQD